MATSVAGRTCHISTQFYGNHKFHLILAFPQFLRNTMQHPLQVAVSVSVRCSTVAPSTSSSCLAPPPSFPLHVIDISCAGFKKACPVYQLPVASCNFIAIKTGCHTTLPLFLSLPLFLLCLLLSVLLSLVGSSLAALCIFIKNCLLRLKANQANCKFLLLAPAL